MWLAQIAAGSWYFCQLVSRQAAFCAYHASMLYSSSLGVLSCASLSLSLAIEQIRSPDGRACPVHVPSASSSLFFLCFFFFASVPLLLVKRSGTVFVSEAFTFSVRFEGNVDNRCIYSAYRCASVSSTPTCVTLSCGLVLCSVHSSRRCVIS